MADECPNCAVLRRALDEAVRRAEQIEVRARSIAIDADTIQCIENDTRQDMGLPPKPEE